MRLEAKNLSFSYNVKGRQILRQFSLSADSSERVGIIAPSGFGKTTLCKILSGYEAPVNPRLRMKNVIEEGDRTAPELIEKLGIEPDWMNRFPTELSGGELQRFCIARALGQRTRFLLADEITTMLDLITQSQIWHFLIEETERRNIGMLVVSHSPELIKKVCTRVIELDK